MAKTSTPADDDAPKLKRGTIKRFREYLNAKFAMSEKHTGGRSGQYQQKTRLYGDYLYHQDREQFKVELKYALAGNDHKDFAP